MGRNKSETTEKFPRRTMLILAALTMLAALSSCESPPPDDEMTLRLDFEAANELGSYDSIPEILPLLDDSDPVGEDQYLVESIPADLGKLERYKRNYFFTFNAKGEGKRPLIGCESIELIETRQAADYRFEITSEGVQDLHVFFIPDDPSRETFLIIHNASFDGIGPLEFDCFDGSALRDEFETEPFPEGTQAPPLASFENPSLGVYSIWVGSKPEDDDDEFSFKIHGTLFVSSSNALDPVNMRLNLQADEEVTTVDIDAELETFVPEPHVIAIRGTDKDPLNGIVDSSYLATRGFLNINREEDDAILSQEYWSDEPSCRGYATSQPNVVVNWPEPIREDEKLRIYFVADDGYLDDTLIVHFERVDEEVPLIQQTMLGWYCSQYDWIAEEALADPSGALIEFVNPPAGTFRIWIAGNPDDPDDPIAGRLFISRLPLFHTADPGWLNVERMTRTEPLEVEVPADGGLAAVLAQMGVDAVPAGEMVIGVPEVHAAEPDESAANPDCDNLVAPYQPETQVIWPAPVGRSSVFMGIFLVPEDPDAEDVALIVIDPEGDLFCSTAFPNPGIPIDDAPPGLYTIWIGSVSPGAGQAGNLYISGCPEFDPSKPVDNPCLPDNAGG